MSIQYHLYGNDGAGGPIDYTTVLATVTGLTWDTSALAKPSDNLFGLRAFDSVSGLEEQNTDAVVRLVIDAAGNNITNRPNAPTGLTLKQRAGGSLLVSWQYAPGGQGGPPTGFHVYIGSPTVAYVTPAATVAYSRGRPTFSVTLSGLADGTYQVGVRAYNATAEEPNTATVTVTVSSTGPDPVDDLSGSAVP